MSDCPRTDAVHFKMSYDPSRYDEHDALDLCRQLERELSAALSAQQPVAWTGLTEEGMRGVHGKSDPLFPFASPPPAP